jgi:hypothetical protein
LEELYEKLHVLQRANENSKRDMNLQATQFKTQISKLRDEKAEIEKQLFSAEFLVDEKTKEIEKSKDELKI